MFAYCERLTLQSTGSCPEQAAAAVAAAVVEEAVLPSLAEQSVLALQQLSVILGVALLVGGMFAGMDNIHNGIFNFLLHFYIYITKRISHIFALFPDVEEPLQP